MRTERQLTAAAILTFLVVLVWTGVHFYGQYTQSTVSATLQEQIAPITPQFDLETLQQLAKRQSVTPEYQATGSPSAQAVQPPVSTTVLPAILPSPTILPLPSLPQSLPLSSPGGILR